HLCPTACDTENLPCRCRFRNLGAAVDRAMPTSGARRNAGEAVRNAFSGLPVDPRGSHAVRATLTFLAAAAALSVLHSAPAAPLAAANPYGAWRSGPARDAAFFPIAVWLQDPAMATRYREAGIKLYVGLWRG